MKKSFIFIFCFLVLMLTSCMTISDKVAEQFLNTENYKNGKNKINRATFMGSVESEKLHSTVENRKTKWMETLTEKEQWTIITEDGYKLVGDFYPNKNSHLYLITAHGLLNNGSQMLDHASLFAAWEDEGWTFLIPDCRAHGKSGGKYLGLGYLDKNDFLLWINKIIEYDENAQIVLLGQSFGAATMLMVASSDRLPVNVKCVISDCGYSSAFGVVKNLVSSKIHIFKNLVLQYLDSGVKHTVGYSLKDAAPKEVLKNCRIPVLFIQGNNDKVVNPKMVFENAESLVNTPYEVLMIESAGHGQSLYTNPALYSSVVENFVKKYINQ